MKFKGFICIVFSLVSIINMSYGQGETNEKTPEIEWLTFEEVEEKLKIEPKKMLVDIYRKGCGWCKKMEQETFQDSVIVDYINRNFYAVKLDGEHKEPISFQGKTYNFMKKDNVSYHELSMEITRGNKILPSVVFLDEKVNVIQSFSGYKEPTDFEKIMTYFAGNHHFTTPWIRYEAIYQSRNKERNKLQINTMAAPAPSSN